MGPEVEARREPPASPLPIRVPPPFRQGRARPPAGGMAQLVERLLCKQDVAGSNPAASTNSPGLVAQLVRARP